MRAKGKAKATEPEEDEEVEEEQEEEDQLGTQLSRWSTRPKRAAPPTKISQELYSPSKRPRTASPEGDEAEAEVEEDALDTLLREDSPSQVSQGKKRAREQDDDEADEQEQEPLRATPMAEDAFELGDLPETETQPDYSTGPRGGSGGERPGFEREASIVSDISLSDVPRKRVRR